ncbi:MULTISPECIES: type II toxin-antitoxin system RelE/ParE family toxin [unclassified Streptomyces]|uniref:type II toxin-antitoxin system RelE family toxin n=1 Tax=unclassified Streptomyces TaxID=2593676 RepID=UPI0034197641
MTLLTKIHRSTRLSARSHLRPHLRQAHTSPTPEGAAGTPKQERGPQPEGRRLRVSDYRVVYTIDNGELVVWVVHVGHRSTVYET